MMPDTRQRSSDNYREFSAITITQAATTLVVIVMLAVGFVLASEIILTLFLAVLFGIFLYRVSRLVANRTALSDGWSLGIVVSVLLLLSVGTGVMFWTQVDQQLDSASRQIDEGFAKLREVAEVRPSIRSAIGSVPFLSEALGVEQPHGGNSSSKAPEGPLSGETNQTSLPPVQPTANAIGGIFKTTFGLVVNSMLIFFVGLFVASSPETYRDGVVKLVPPSRRERVTDVMDLLGDTMWRWLLGRFGSMLVTGIGAFLILVVIGVPMAATLGIITALLTFIPNIGAAIALILAMLFALPQGVNTALMVIPGYMILQLVESYLVTPLIQQRQVSLPPALLIAFQAIMGVLFGFMGAAVASPLLAASKVAVEELYIEDVLEQ